MVLLEKLERQIHCLFERMLRELRLPSLPFARSTLFEFLLLFLRRHWLEKRMNVLFIASYLYMLEVGLA